MTETKIGLLFGGVILLVVVLFLVFGRNDKGASDNHVESGDSFFKRGELDNAIKCFRRALDVGKYKKYSRVIAQTKLAKCFAEKGDIETAKSLLEECLRFSSTDKPSRLALGELYYAQKRYDEAILLFNGYVEILPDKDTYYKLALCYAKLGMEKEANVAANKAIELKCGSGSAVRREVKQALASAKKVKETK
jgi:Predicted N-acetylglucosaminyl transferase